MLEIIETGILVAAVVLFAVVAPAKKYRLVPVLELLLGAIGLVWAITKFIRCLRRRRTKAV